MFAKNVFGSHLESIICKTINVRGRKAPCGTYSPISVTAITQRRPLGACQPCALCLRAPQNIILLYNNNIIVRDYYR